MEAVMEDLGTLPKELLAFIERKAERAIEVLREIVSEPEPQQTAPAFGGLNAGTFVGGGLSNNGTAQQAATPSQMWNNAQAMQNTTNPFIISTATAWQ